MLFTTLSKNMKTFKLSFYPTVKHVSVNTVTGEISVAHKSSYVYKHPTQQTFTYSKSTIETLEKRQ